MKKSNLFLFMCILFCSYQSFAQDWLWEKTEKTSGNQSIWRMIIDNDGNTYYILNFTDNFNLNGINYSALEFDGLLVKLNSQGETIWTKQFGGSGYCMLMNLDFDKEGNLVVSGEFKDDLVIDDLSIISAGSNDVFLCKIGQDGQLYWLVNLLSGLDNQRGDITLDSQNNIYVSGRSVGNFTFAGQNFNNYPASTFLAKLTPDLQIIWIKNFESGDMASRLWEPLIHANGIYLHGAVKTYINLDGNYLTSNGLRNDVFFVNFDADGNIVWIRKIISPDVEHLDDIAVDSNDNLYFVIGTQGGSCEIDKNASDVVTLNYSSTNFYERPIYGKYSPEGNLLWAKQIESDYMMLLSMYLKNNEILFAGNVRRTTTINGATFTPPSSVSNFFYMVTDLDGNIVNYDKIYQTDPIGYSIFSCLIDNKWNFYFSGMSTSSVTGNDYHIRKYGCFDQINMTSTPVTCVDQFGVDLSTDGTATASPLYAKAPYNILWNNNGTTATISGLTMGDYTVTISDNVGCTAQATVTVGNLPPLGSAVVSVTNLSCFHSADGAAEVTGVDGKPPYTYLWPNGSVTPSLTGLGAHPYNISITDQCNASVVQVVSPTEPNAMNIDFVTGCATAGQCDGFATATALGGTSPYTYLWDNGEATADIYNLCQGQYHITITDVNGCQTKANEKAMIKNCKLKSLSYSNSVVNDEVLGIYPNPAQNNIYINTTEFADNSRLYIYNTTGQCLMSLEINEDNKSIDVSNFESGVYFVKLKTSNNTIIEKLIISKE